MTFPRIRPTILLGVLALCCIHGPASAQPVRVGTPFDIVTSPAAAFIGDVAVDGADVAAAFWEDDEHVRLGGRILDLTGGPPGPMFRLDQPPGTTGARIAAAGLPGGGFVAVWEVFAGGNIQIYAQCLGGDGSLRGAARRIDQHPDAANQFPGNPAVAVGPSGRIFAVWDADEVNSSPLEGRILDTDCVPVADAFTIDGPPPGASAPKVAADVEGRFLLVWEAGGIGAQARGNDGVAAGPVVTVTERRLSLAGDVAVAADPRGGFLVAWIDRDPLGYGLNARAGFPGWHIECSAMSAKYLGQEFDIHGGGLDLAATHHTNEIAQSEACSHHQPAKYWMHTNMLTVNGTRMSKSAGNGFLPGELFTGSHPLLKKGYSPMTVKFFMLQAHYRSTLDFSNEALEASEKGFRRLMTALSLLPKLTVSEQSDFEIEQLRINCINAMNDDFNSPIVIAELFEAVRIINTVYDGGARISLTELEKLKALMNNFVFDVFGLKDEDSSNIELNDVLDMVIALRKDAKENKDYATSDKIRIGLQEMGIQLKDSKEGTTWSKV